ncbi:Helix-turn-helix domain-containing protein [Mycetocola miduiensis]|uniref:Helix-turn-helix domain-containing protein n=2 Tax=Mycetocola miduiensis TaxID=995034 RepID=A0A1I4ZL18_9MICO|nr:Helix-turn-helix domain-containing protein [Mycetocola miduiensis]
MRNSDGSARAVQASSAYLTGMNETAQIAQTFLTQRELAELLQLPERTLEDWRLTHAGPPYMKLGRHVRYDIADVLAWAKEKRRA